MRLKRKLNVQTFANWEEVPIFDSEVAEADFWADNRPDLRRARARRRNR